MEPGSELKKLLERRKAIIRSQEEEQQSKERQQQHQHGERKAENLKKTRTEDEGEERLEKRRVEQEERLERMKSEKEEHERLDCEPDSERGIEGKLDKERKYESLDEKNAGPKKEQLGKSDQYEHFGKLQKERDQMKNLKKLKKIHGYIEEKLDSANFNKNELHEPQREEELKRIELGGQIERRAGIESNKKPCEDIAKDIQPTRNPTISNTGLINKNNYADDDNNDDVIYRPKSLKASKSCADLTCDEENSSHKFNRALRSRRSISWADPKKVNREKESGVLNKCLRKFLPALFKKNAPEAEKSQNRRRCLSMDNLSDEKVPVHQQNARPNEYVDLSSLKNANVSENDLNEQKLRSSKEKSRISTFDADIFNKVIAICSYKPERKDELMFNKGDTITVLDRTGDQWGWGACRGKEGYFPGNYVIEISDLLQACGKDV